jgi:hypothetical protein
MDRTRPSLNPTAYLVVLSLAKDLAEGAGMGHVAGVRSFAALRTTEKRTLPYGSSWR